MIWTLRGTHPEGGVAVCDRCGKPRQVRFSEVRPEGFEGPSPYGELLPCTCDCYDAEQARGAVAAMLRASDRPMVAFRGCACPEAARAVAGTFSRTVPANFVAYADDALVAACVTSRFVYDAIRGGTLSLAKTLPIGVRAGRDFGERAAAERAKYALLTPIDSLTGAM